MGRKTSKLAIGAGVLFVLLFAAVSWRAGAVLALLLLVAAAIDRAVEHVAGRTARRVASGCCPACGYDLRESPRRCPECGYVPPHGMRVPYDAWLRTEFEQAAPSSTEANAGPGRAVKTGDDAAKDRAAGSAGKTGDRS